MRTPLKLYSALAAALTFGASALAADVFFITKREAVAQGAVYEVASNQQWQTRCVRAAKDKDECVAQSDVQGAIPLVIRLKSLPVDKQKVDADVDVVPVGELQLQISTGTELDTMVYVGIASLDGSPFDGFLCNAADTSKCLRGPKLDKVSWQKLIRARTAEFGYYQKVARQNDDSVPENLENFTLEKFASAKVSLNGLGRSVEAAEKQMATLQNLPTYGKLMPVNACVSSIEGKKKLISFADDPKYGAEITTLRESIFGPKGDGDCPSYVTLAYLTPGFTSSQRSIFCLAYDKQTKTYQGVAQGPHDAYNLCKTPPSAFCKQVNTAKGKALAVAAVAGGSASTAGAASALGYSVVLHSSGAAILTGSAGYVAGTLGTAAVTALGVVTAPVTVVLSTATAASLGAAVLACQ